MTDVKLLLSTLIETCERLYTERQILESLLVGARVPGWRGMYEQLANAPDSQLAIHEQFQPLYDLATREADAAQALEELLRVLPKPARWN